MLLLCRVACCPLPEAGSAARIGRGGPSGPLPYSAMLRHFACILMLMPLQTQNRGRPLSANQIYLCRSGRTEIKPGKHSDTRVKPLPLANDHGRYTTVINTSERAIVSVGKWPLHIIHSRYNFLTISLLKRSRNGRFTSEKNGHLDPELV